jgi:MFS family permease
MNGWEDEKVRGAVLATGKKRLLIAGLLTEACISFPALSALQEGFEVFVVADASGGLTYLSWVVTAYLLAGTVAAPLYGRMGDAFGCFGHWISGGER